MKFMTKSKSKWLVALLLTSSTFGAQTQCGGLNAWYRAYNDMYFQGKLPKDTRILRAKLKPESIATTECEDDGTRCVIIYNTVYSLGPALEHQVLKHEQCHIWSWKEKFEHGPAWVKCMKSLRAQGSFDQDEIYDSTGEGNE